MAEIGNILFDRCDGGFEVPRGAGFEEELQRLFDAVEPDRDKSWRDYGPSFESGTFQIWPYSWCDCDCGYNAVEAEWSKGNQHREDCYQSRSRRALAEWDAMNDYDKKNKASYCDVEREVTQEFMGIPMSVHISERSPRAEAAHREWSKLYDLRQKFEEKTRKELCKALGISWNKGYGSAVHCTCDFEKQWAHFRESHTHDQRCQVARKSLLFKPTGFWLDWYKYPLRDAHSSSHVSLEEFGEIVDRCIASLSTDKGGPIITLAKARGDVNA
jgi:hypothetical protein